MDVFNAVFEPDEQVFDARFENVIVVHEGYVPPYEGEYEVVPSLHEQVLQTRHKRMEDDVTVKEIPYAEAHNDAGGVTISIAS